MKTPALILTLLCTLTLSWIPDTRAKTADRDRIARLIGRLANPRFSARRQAYRELDAIGAPALVALRKARKDPDLETCRLARELVARIEQRLDTAAVLAPTRVRLVCIDMPVSEAIAELARKARIEILIHPASKDKLARRKVSLDTGEVTFWEAFDALCQKGGLVETDFPISSHQVLQREQQVEQLLLRAQLMKRLMVPAQPAIKLVPQPLKRNIKKVPLPPQKPKPVEAGPAKPPEQKAKAKPGPAAKPVVARKRKVMPAPNLAQIRRFQALIQARQAALSDLVYAVPEVVDNSRIVVADGKPEVVPTYYAGAFRIRARTSPGRDKQAAAVTFEVTAEPRHRGYDLVGAPRLDKATDDQGQALAPLVEPRPQEMIGNQWAVQQRLVVQMEWRYYGGRVSSPPLKRTVQMQLQFGPKPARFSDIAGQLLVEAKTDVQPLIIVDQILRAAGKTIRGARGGSIQVIDTTWDKDGNYLIRYKLEVPPGCVGSSAGPMDQLAAVNFRGAIINPAAGPSLPGSMALVDAKGAAFPLVGHSVTSANGEVVQSLTFRAQPGREPARLIFSAQRRVYGQVPFALKGLKLR